MSFRNTANSYGSVAKFFHWLIFLLLAAMLSFGFFMDDIPEEYKGMTYNVHKLTGLSILALMVMRALWTMANPKPQSAPGTQAWEKIVEKIVHYLLYITVIAMPIAGWVGSSAAGKFPHIGEMQFVLPIEKSKPLVDVSFETHEILAYTIIALVSLHILAALFHHYIRRDNILLRMLPGKGRR